jgi:hypothetical protein
MYFSMTLTVAAAVLVHGRENMFAQVALVSALMGTMMLTTARRVALQMKKETHNERKYLLLIYFTFVAELFVWLAASFVMIATKGTALHQTSWTFVALHMLIAGLLHFGYMLDF